MSILKIEVGSTEIEVAHYVISEQEKNRIDEYCENEYVGYDDVLYDDDVISKLTDDDIQYWYENSQICSIAGSSIDDFDIEIFIDDEEIEFDQSKIKIEVVKEEISKVDDGYYNMSGGMFNKGYHTYQTEINDTFNIEKLTFHLLNLDDLKIDDAILDNITYDGKGLDKELGDSDGKGSLEVNIWK